MSGDLTARDVIARWMCAEETRAHADADDLLAALAAAGWRLERDDQWEWGVRFPGRRTPIYEDWSGEQGRELAMACAGQYAGTIVRRRPAGEWEVCDA